MIDLETLKQHNDKIKEAATALVNAKKALTESEVLKEFNKCQNTLGAYHAGFNSWLKTQLNISEDTNEILIPELLTKCLNDNKQSN